ncbi:ATP-binding protein [Actinomycetospora sp. CA-053990]|uniref:sensor histidine kinase n=1 Tax=Actinomycetospora sp. CA-053990 TaxID=3239891 RepID=UPI003D919534
MSRRLQAFLPELRPVDAVVAGVLLVMVAIAALSLAAQDPGEVPIVAALVTGAVQTLPVLWRRERPIAALLVYAASVVPAAWIVGSALTLYTWAVLLFAVVRRSRPLPGAVAVVGTSLVVPVLVGVVLQPGEVDTALGVAVGLAASLLPVLAVAGALGIVARLRAERLGAQRRRDERDRLADALAEQRDRLAGDLRGLVAVRVEHVVARTGALAADPAGPDLADRLTATAGEARAALAGMRRALGLLRDEPAEAVPVPVATPADEHGTSWLPSRGGLVLAGVLGAVVALLAVLADAAAPHLEPGAAADLVGMLDVDPGRPLALLPLVVQVLSVAWWRRAPLPALVVATAGSCAASALGSTHLVTEGAWSILVYGAGLGAGLVPSAVTVAGCTAVVLATTVTIADLPASLTASRASWALSYVLVPAIWGLGVFHRRHAQAEARRAEAREAASAERAVRLQRLGLARELHDVLAHELSALVVTLHAARVAPSAEALTAIGEAGERIASALPPLLAGTGAGSADDAGLDAVAVEALAAPVRDAGLPVTVEVVGTAPPDRPEADVFAARILTEALTNTLRHAGPTPTRVTVRHDEDAVAVEVVDAGAQPGHRASREGSGLGLVGMRERAALVGGSVEAGPAGNGWRVAARLPRRAAGLLLEEEGEGRGSPPRRTITAPSSP